MCGGQDYVAMADRTGIAIFNVFRDMPPHLVQHISMRDRVATETWITRKLACTDEYIYAWPYDQSANMINSVLPAVEIRGNRTELARLPSIFIIRIDRLLDNFGGDDASSSSNRSSNITGATPHIRLLYVDDDDGASAIVTAVVPHRTWVYMGFRDGHMCVFSTRLQTLNDPSV